MIKLIWGYIRGLSFFEANPDLPGVYLIVGSHPTWSTVWHFAIDWFSPWAKYKVPGLVLGFQFRVQKLEKIS